MIEQFNEILTQLGNDLDLNLSPENGKASTLKIDDMLLLQLEIDKTEENILIASSLFTLPPGKFRENVFQSTLKANGLLPPRFIFGFNEPSAELIFFQFLPLKNLTLKIVKKNLEEFIEEAMKWKEALEGGQSAPIDFIRSLEESKPSIFTPSPPR